MILSDTRAHSSVIQPMWMRWFSSISASELQAYLRLKGIVRDWQVGTHCMYFKFQSPNGDGMKTVVVDRSYDLNGYEWSTHDERTGRLVVAPRRFGTYGTPESAMLGAEEYIFQFQSTNGDKS